MKKIVSILGLCSLLSVPVLVIGESWIEIENAWARENPPVVPNGAVYMTLINQGDEADRLLGVSGEVAETIELHTHRMEGTVMKMRKIHGVEVSPGAPTVLEPGGAHVMLIGLKQPLVKGRRFPLTLHFEKAGDVRIEVPVRRPGEAP